MKNSQKGFAVPLLVTIVILLFIGGGVYVYKTKKVEVPALIGNITQQSDQDQNIDSQNGNFTPTPTTQNADANLVQPAVTILSPNGDERLKAGESIKIKWMSNVKAVSRVDLYLLSGSKCPPGYHCTPLPNTMAVIATLESINANLGNYEWIVDTANVKDYGTGYYVKVVLLDDSGKSFVDESDSNFLIVQ